MVKWFLARICSLVFFLLCSLVAFAQRPVQVIPTVMPPYSTLLSEYYSGTQPRLSVMLLNTDSNEPFLQVYLRMSIVGQGVNLQSTPYGNYPTIDLMTGAMVTVSQSDLAPYFNSHNLIGNTGVGQNRLPEGFYEFCFEVYEKNTNRLVGDKKCAQAYLTLSDPPFLVLPETTKAISYTNPFNLLFQWTPRHLSNPNAVNTEYQFDLVEIWDTTITPEAAFYTAKPVYSTKITTPNLFYGPGEPQLLMGKKYAWRVQAIVLNSNNEQEPFKNNGYSEIFWFKLQGVCAPLQRATVVADPRTNKTTLSWITDPSNVGSTSLNYRKAGTSKWTTIDAPTNQVTLTGLAWATDYEYQLGNRCVITDDFSYGSLQTFKTLTQDTANCVPSAPARLSNQNPIASLRLGDTIYASGFRMRLTQVSGANGQFSGQGYLALLVPTTTTEVSIKAAFQNIGINTDKQLISGQIISMYDKTEGGVGNLDPITEGGIGTGDVKTGGTSITATVNTTIDPTINAVVNVTVNGSDTSYTVTFTGVDDKPVNINTNKLPAVVQDNTGSIYSIDKTGKITKVGQSASPALLAGKGPDQLDQLAADKGTVTFNAHPDQKYAMDIYLPAYDKSMLFSQQYESLNQGAYRVANKLLVTNSSDKVLVKVSGLPKAWSTDSIHFITAKNIELPATKRSDGNYEITLLSGPANDAQELYAIYRDNAAAKANTNASITNDQFTYSLGKLKIATYAAQTLKVKLVPVGNAQVDRIQISSRLNAIYNTVGITWTVEVADSFAITSDWDTDGDNRLNITGAGKYNQYSDEMKLLNATYLQSNSGIDASSPYLFVFKLSPKAGSDEQGKGTLGDMLRNKQFGYIFLPNNSDIGQTAAHELAHGVFHLNHTFDSQYNLSQGDLPTNLMDYSGGDQLNKLQWDAIYAPGLVIGVFDKEGDAALVKDEYYFRPDGIVFQADANFDIDLIDKSAITNGKVVNGPIYGFKNQTDGSRYVYVLSTDGKFLGYFLNGDKTQVRYQPVQDKLSNLNQATINVNYFNYDGTTCTVTRYATPYTTAKFTDYSWPSVLGNSLATSVLFNPQTAVYKTKANLCGDDNTSDDAPLVAGTPGKQYFDLYYSTSISDADKAYMIKIGNVINKLGSDLCSEFNDQVRTNKALQNDLLFKYASTTKVSGAFGSYADQYGSLKTYSDAVDKLKTYKFSTKEELVTFTNTNFVTQASPKCFFDGPFKFLTGTRKNELLDLYKGVKASDITKRLTINDNPGDEEVLLAIVKNIPNDQSKVVLDHLYSQNLLSLLVEGFDDYDFGGANNLTQLIGCLSGYAVTNYPPQKSATDVNQYKIDGNYLIFNDNFLWDGRSNTESIDPIDSKVSILVQRRNPFNNQVDYRIIADPYKSLLVRFENDFVASDGTKFTGGNSYAMPAIVVYLLFNQDTRNKIKASAKLSFDVAICLIGVGELNAAVKAANWGAAAIGGLDLAIDATDMVVSNVFKQTVEQKYPTFAKNWEYFTAAYSIVRFSAGATGVDKDVEDLYSNLYNDCNTIIVTEKTGDIYDGTKNIKAYLDQDQFNALKKVSSNLVYSNISDAVSANISDISTKLYRGDTRLPSDIFQSGFVSAGTNKDLIKYVDYNDPSIFIGTSKSPDIAYSFTKTSQGGYVYIIDKYDGSIDVNSFYRNVEGFDNPQANELEVVYENVIPTAKIKGAFMIDENGNIIGDLILNSNYQP
jgi:hypothetical protein